MKLEELEEYFQSNLYEMSTWQHTYTGLAPGTKLWVRTEPTELAHVKYRIKIDHPQKGSAVFAIWGDEAHQVDGKWEVTGRDLQKIQALVRITHEELIKHIDGIIDSGDLTFVFQKANPQVKRI